jgi:hypothetical protein
MLSFPFLLIQIPPIQISFRSSIIKIKRMRRITVIRVLDFTSKNGKLVSSHGMFLTLDHVGDWMSDPRVKEFKRDSGKSILSTRNQYINIKTEKIQEDRQWTKFILFRLNATAIFRLGFSIALCDRVDPPELLSHEKRNFDTFWPPDTWLIPLGANTFCGMLA